ncbi:hypothetical protein CI102_7213 [Trichoderma harzianum]|nr:hypothetical protein CI102_7213 [Trichoderma harzianum]
MREKEKGERDKVVRWLYRSPQAKAEQHTAYRNRQPAHIRTPLNPSDLVIIFSSCMHIFIWHALLLCKPPDHLAHGDLRETCSTKRGWPLSPT